jgi:predicted transcriptional regulator
VSTKEYRGRDAIIAQMLRTVNDSQGEGATKTLIMYKSFLSYKQLNEYLSFLVKSGLVDEFSKHIGNSIGTKTTYKITARGLRLLQILQEMENLVSLDSIPYSKKKITK